MNFKDILPSPIRNFFYLPAQTSIVKMNNAVADGAKDLSSYVAPVQFTRSVVDIETWRQGISEAENPILPYRVKMQRIYADTFLNGQTFSCISKRKNLSLLKEYGLFNKDVEIEASALIQKEWFNLLMSYCLDAQFFGYTLVGLGEMENNEFKKLRLIKRENISPDRLSLAPIVYSPQGVVNFMDEEATDANGNSFYDWSIYVSTPSETGQSICGYGLLYKVAIYEIYLRHNLADNATFTELFSQPYRQFKTNKTDRTELDELDKQAKNMGSTAYAITGHDDDIIIHDTSAGGAGYRGYESLEARIEKKISKLLLGHADALDSTPGKLGGGNGEESPVYQALEEITSIDNKFLSNVINTQILPKLRKIGLPIPEGAEFKFKNNSELQEQRENQDRSNKLTADFVKTLYDAGLKVDAAWLTERTGIPLTEFEKPSPQSFNKDTQSILNSLYGKT